MTLTYRHVHAERVFDNIQTSNRSTSGGGHTALLESRRRLTTWHDALVRMQDVLRRARADPDLSQQALFKFCVPLVSFAYVFAVCLAALRWPRAHVILLRVMGESAEEGDGFDRPISAAVSILVFGMIGVVVSLRFVIWAIAYGVGRFVEQEIGSSDGEVGGMGEVNPIELDKTNLLLGGIFM